MRPKKQQQKFINSLNISFDNPIKQKQYPLRQFMTQRSPIKNLFQFEKPQADRSERTPDIQCKFSKKTSIKSHQHKISTKNSRDLSPAPSINSINDKHFKQVEQLLTRENFNLKQHRDFLINEIKKYAHIVKKYKNKLQESYRKIQQLQHQNDVYRLQYMQMRKYVFEGVHRMEQIVEATKQSPISNQQNFLYTRNQSFNTVQLKNYDRQGSFKDPRNTQFNTDKLNNKQKQVIQELRNNLQTCNFPISLKKQHIIQNNRRQSQLTRKQQSRKLGQLNQKFEGLMKQYRRTKDQNIINRCRSISKQIKNVKKNLNPPSPKNENKNYITQQNPEKLGYNFAQNNLEIENNCFSHNADELHINFENTENLRNTQRAQYFQIKQYQGKQEYDKSRSPSKNLQQFPSYYKVSNQKMFRSPSGGLNNEIFYTKRKQQTNALKQNYTNFDG